MKETILEAENKALKAKLAKVKYMIQFPKSVAAQATNGKVQYEGDDYWFILSALKKIEALLEEV